MNRESARIYTGVLVEHWRAYRKSSKQWLSPVADEKLSDFLTRHDQPLLHSHSKDAAQQAFAKACKTTSVLRKQGFEAHFPRKRKFYRTTIWKSTGIRVRTGRHTVMVLAKAKGLAPIEVQLPAALSGLPPNSFVEARLVWDIASSQYDWHLVVEDGIPVPQVLPMAGPGSVAIGIDLGEIHPAVCTNGITTVVISCRRLRSLRQYTQKRGSIFRSLQSNKQKHSRRWERLKKQENRFRALQKRRVRDLEHKISKEIVRYAVECNATTMAVGDVRDIANNTDKGKKHNQRMSTWAHGRLRSYFTYKAQYSGIQVVFQDERYTTQSCPSRGYRTKPKGRVFTCLACGFRGHRDAVGAANILSRYKYGDVSKIPATEPMYRFPHKMWVKRSSPDTGLVPTLVQVALGSSNTGTGEATAR